MNALNHVDPVAAATSDRAVACGVVVGAEAAALRRQLGPMAWCPLEVVVAVSDDDGLAVVSVRSLAAELGVSKNTAQRALTILRAVGLAVPAPARRVGGRFAVGAYRIAILRSALTRVEAASLSSVSVGGDIPTTAAVAEASSVAATPGRSRRAVRPVVVEQLSLLPEV